MYTIRKKVDYDTNQPPLVSPVPSHFICFASIPIENLINN